MPGRVDAIEEPGGTSPVLFLDFDGTIASCDVLDALIARYSVSDAWRGLEADWESGRITTVECLRGQVRDLRLPFAELVAFAGEQSLDPAFAAIVAWADARRVPLSILSDSFTCLIIAVLGAHGLQHVLVRGNELVFDGDRVEPRFPWHDTRCAGCAHCKAQHLRATSRRPRIFVGDGRSDLCAALEADVVFAKAPLGALLEQRGVPYRPFESLSEVAAFLATMDHPAEAHLR